MSKGILFNIQKFSIHDGPGIRTTLFLKGCPLRCQWCANPESQLAKIQILYHQEDCLHCLNCIQLCPTHALTHQDQCIHVDFNKCIGCLECVKNCPGHALSNEGEYKSVEEVVAICLQDLPFYEESGGGITISGGEGMSQPDFLRELLPALKKHNLHLAIETTGYVPEDLFHELAPMFDLLLFDIKHADSKKHQTGTKVGNELIRKNLKWAIEQHIEILPRIPVIPHFNDSLDDAKLIATYLKELGLKKVQLLPFHQMGEKKYQLLHRNYAYENTKALHPEDLLSYQQIFTDQGIDCFF